MSEYQAMNYNDGLGVGVIKSGDGGYSWVVEPYYTWDVAKQMATALNENPAIDPDELYKLARVTA